MTLEFFLRIFVASLLGGIIGLEREYRAKEAGFRTHFLVALGSALFMILSQYGFDSVLGQLDKASFDPSRIASQVVTGIGFIGAGTIILQKHVVRGLTTAAGLWVTSAIGLTCGSGLYLLAIACTVLVLLCLEALNFILKRFGTKNIAVTFVANNTEIVNHILQELREDEIDIDSYEMHELHTPNGIAYQVTLELKVRRDKYQSRILGMMNEFDNVTIQSIE